VTGTAFAALPQVRGIVNDAITVTLPESRPAVLAASRDYGLIDGRTALPHVRLVLTRPPDRQAALDRLTDDQYRIGSPDYHRWLKPADLRAFGPADADVRQVTAWLQRHGLRVNSVSRSGMAIDFGGTAAQVESAFHTQIHNVAYDGEAHISNVTPTAVPAALAPLVSGVVLHNFGPKPMMRRLSPNFTIPFGKSAIYAVAPADFATIYNLNPLRTTHNYYGAPITGTGITLAVLEDSMMNPADWKKFRQTFGLAQYPGTLTLVNPGGCASPGFNGAEGEAALDTEWSSAVAPSANIIQAGCAGTPPYEFGVINTMENLVEDGTPATIFSVSYGFSEVGFGFPLVKTWTNLAQEAAAEGITVFVSSGDSGSAADRDRIDGQGLGVNGFASSAYVTSVGGTDFLDTSLNENATYWSPTNGKNRSSALSYIPETPWNNSCASPIIAAFHGYTDPIAFCNGGKGEVQNGVGGSGGQSLYYTKPGWQLTGIPGMPNDGVRDQPDVSLFAANGIWNHFYVFCMSDTSEGGAPCNYTNINDIFPNAAGGTSFSSPAFAGIAALIQQTNGVKLGNAAPVFYAIAKAQFTTPLGLSGCNASLGNQISSACVFQYVTDGNNAQACFAATPSCETSPASTKGIGITAATVGGQLEFAFPAQTGYSLATGLGSVNIPNLLYAYYPGL
jgi:subtilase family serine protease